MKLNIPLQGFISFYPSFLRLCVTFFLIFRCR